MAFYAESSILDSKWWRWFIELNWKESVHMSWDMLIQQYFSKFTFLEPIAVADVSSVMGVVLPDDYLEFMHKYYGGEGVVWKESYLTLFPLLKLQEVNGDYCVDEFLPNHCIIASSGGGEFYCIDNNGHYFIVPTIMSEEDKIFIGRTFVEFIVNLDKQEIGVLPYEKVIQRNKKTI